jgi:hypothetical protein
MPSIFESRGYRARLKQVQQQLDFALGFNMVDKTVISFAYEYPSAFVILTD